MSSAGKALAVTGAAMATCLVPIGSASAVDAGHPAARAYVSSYKGPRIDIDGDTWGQAIATCPAGMVATGGGYEVTSRTLQIIVNAPSGNDGQPTRAWVIIGYNPPGSFMTQLTPWVTCTTT
ncbi:hypothetical protein ACIRD3_03300 [Kitasatospora sp. NPDC093550]|uniref:hypothetical protein n=1 Tax=Kitasatospora sp. NPDC093550 TaxID=3364089 RepID=UPI003814A56C